VVAKELAWTVLTSISKKRDKIYTCKINSQNLIFPVIKLMASKQTQTQPRFPLVGIPVSPMPENYAGTSDFGMPGIHCRLKNKQPSVTGRPEIVNLEPGGPRLGLLNTFMAQTEQHMTYKSRSSFNCYVKFGSVMVCITTLHL